MNLLICDDHPVVRSGLRKDIADLMGFNHRVDDAKNGEQAIELLKQNQYDIVLMDIQLPGKSGMDVLQHIILKYPGLPVLMLSNFEDIDYGYESYKQGAAGFLNKTVLPSELIFSIKKVVGGGKCFSSMVMQMADDARKSHKKTHTEYGHELLTDQKIKILIMSCEGKSQQYIGSKMHIEVGSVSSHLKQIDFIMNFTNKCDRMSYYQNHLKGKIKL